MLLDNSNHYIYNTQDAEGSKGITKYLRLFIKELIILILIPLIILF